MIWSWLFLTLGVQVITPMLNPKGYARGKYFTMPLRRHVKWFDTPFCRLKQYLTLIVLNEIFSFHFGDKTTYFYFMAIILLHLDDYLTKDDDGNKKPAKAGNKKKWKMKLPQPVPAELR